MAEPHVAPHRCGLCGNGSENPRCKPFLATGWRFSEESDSEFRMQVAAAGQHELFICAMCFKAAAETEGSPIRPTKAEAPRLHNALVEIVEQKEKQVAEAVALDAAKIIAAYVDEQARLRMANARAARGKAKE